MRRTLTSAIILMFLLAACQMMVPGGGGQGLQEEAISVTPLAAPGVAVIPSAGPTAVLSATPRPRTRPEGQSVSEAPAVTPTGAESLPPAEAVVPKTAEQLLCEKARGQWVAAGDTGAYYCASMTRDGGKQCNKKTQCQGQCLARSGTCSPITPLYGCNDVLEKDGRQVTLCID